MTTQTNKGFVTLEISIAIMILATTLSAIILISFGSQSLLADARTNSDALSDAQKILRDTEATAQKDFRLVQATSSADGRYLISLSVLSEDFFSKEIAATVSWDADTIRPQHITLREHITDFENFGDDDTCDSNLSGDWTHPHVINSVTNFAALAQDPTHTYSISDVDTYKNRLYVAANNTTNKTDSTFFIFDISDSTHPQLMGKLDNAPTTVAGINALTIASSSAEHIAFAANAVQSNFSTCTTGKNCAQLQIIDISSPVNPTIISNFEIPTSTAPFVTGSSGKAVGQSIFYKNGYVYIGLSKTGTGPEFNIIDVHDPLHPQWIGGYSVGFSINDIYIRNNNAYIAHTTDNSAAIQEQLTILDVSNPANPFRVGGFYDAAGVFNSGKTVEIIGDTLYLGRLASKTLPGPTDSIPEFYAIDISNPHAISGALGTTSLQTPESLHGLVIRGSEAFFVTSSQFQIWNIDTLSHITQTAFIPLPTGGATTPSMDCEKNAIFVGSNDITNEGFLSVITSAQ